MSNTVPRARQLVQLVITPINSNKYSKSYKDYVEFEKRKKDNLSLMWDGLSSDNEESNPIHIDDFFAFQFNKSKKQPNPRVEIHRIKQKLTANDRLSSWAENVGQTNLLTSL